MIVAATDKVLVGALLLVLLNLSIREVISFNYVVDEEGVHFFPNHGEEILLLRECLHFVTELFGDLKVEIACASIHYLDLDRIKLF